jgi:starch synthase/alpha-amylase
MGLPVAARGGGLADVSAILVDRLSRLGIDVHVVLPEYRFVGRALRYYMKSDNYINKVRLKGLHLVRDRAFACTDRIYSENPAENVRRALVFQREIVNHVIPFLKPDLVHCHDWMTGLLPAVCRTWRIPCLFTLHSENNGHCTLAEIEDRGIDAALFWRRLYFAEYPGTYERIRNSLPVDLLLSGVFAAPMVNNAAPSLCRVSDAAATDSQTALYRELGRKRTAGRLSWVLNADHPEFNPAADRALAKTYSADTHQIGKAINKAHLQENLGLMPSPWAPLFLLCLNRFAEAGGIHRITPLIASLVNTFRDHYLQFVLRCEDGIGAALRDSMRRHPLAGRVAVFDPDERRSKLACAAADYMLLPTAFDASGPMTIIGSRYGALPVVSRRVGYNPVEKLDVLHNSGSGFLFEHFDNGNLASAVQRTIEFYRLPAAIRARQVSRVMGQSGADTRSAMFIYRHLRLYGSLLGRPVLAPGRRPSQKCRPALPTAKSGHHQGIRDEVLTGAAGLRPPPSECANDDMRARPRRSAKSFVSPPERISGRRTPSAMKKAIQGRSI